MNGLYHLSFLEYVAVVLLLTHITIVSVTIYLHRFSAHRALTMSPILAHFFRFWLWLTTGMVTKEWTAIHRKHHAKCETKDDPHSPHHYGLKTLMTQGAELYKKEALNKETLERYGSGTPDDWLERNIYCHSVIGVSLMLIIDFILFGFVGLTIWAIQMIWIPFWAAGIINGVGHFYGYRNFVTKDAATNIFPIGILIGGEELHNNHHAFGTSAKLSNKWYEFDIGWMYLKIFSFFGLVNIKKVAPKVRVSKCPNMIDESSLDNLIINRQDFLLKFSREIIKEFRKENLERFAIKNIKKQLSTVNGVMPLKLRESIIDFVNDKAKFKALIEMREKIIQLWENKELSQQQMVSLLKEWCTSAESSGYDILQKLSIRARSYTI